MAKDKTVAEIIADSLARHGVDSHFLAKPALGGTAGLRRRGHPSRHLSHRKRRRRHGRRLRAHLRQGGRRHGPERTRRDAAGAAAGRGAEILGAHRRAGAGSRSSDDGSQCVPGTRPFRAVRRLRQMDPPRDRAVANRGLCRHGVHRGHRRAAGPRGAVAARRPAQGAHHRIRRAAAPTSATIRSTARCRTRRASMRPPR